MTKTFSLGVLAAVVVVAGIAAAAVGRSSGGAQSNGGRVARGQYLVTVGGCNDCHTPLKMGANGPEPDMERMLSGHPESFPIAAGIKTASDTWMMTAAATGTAFSGPWGVSFAANLTPDQNTGLGIWTEEMFMKAVRTGRHMGASRPILPPMPWFNVGAMTDEDLRAVYAFLRSIRPLHNRVPDPLPPGGEPRASN